MVKNEAEAPPPDWPEGAFVKEEPWAKEEEAPPAWLEGAIVKEEMEEEEPPVWPEGAIVKHEQQVLQEQCEQHGLQEQQELVRIRPQDEASPMQQCGGHGCELARFHNGLCTSQQVVGPRQRRPSARVLAVPGAGLQQVEQQQQCQREKQLLHAPLPQSKYPGVHWHQASAKWRGAVRNAADRHRGKKRYTKCFADEDECIEARKELKRTNDERNAKKRMHVKQELVEECEEDEESEEGEEDKNDVGDGATVAQRCGGHGCELARFHEGLCTSQRVVGPRQRRPSARVLAVAEADDASAPGCGPAKKRAAPPSEDIEGNEEDEVEEAEGQRSPTFEAFHP